MPSRPAGPAEAAEGEANGEDHGPVQALPVPEEVRILLGFFWESFVAFKFEVYVSHSRPLVLLLISLRLALR